MKRLNIAGESFGKLPYIIAMTDVTGFGLLGHLTEMCQASKASAVIHIAQVPVLDKSIIDHYLAQKCVPGGTNRNWDSYGHHIAGVDDHSRSILADPQTSGGLLVAVEPHHVEDFLREAAAIGLQLESFGFFIEPVEALITVV
jgi:selenide,water dikinase